MSGSIITKYGQAFLKTDSGGFFMYCRYCGKELPNDSKFCVYCGQGVSGPEIFGQNARGRDEARNRAVFEEKQGAGNDYRPYPISDERRAFFRSSFWLQ